jgi:phage repressor protein C with HTH and peptisase S24 domain
LVSTVQNEIIIKELRRNTGDRLELTALSSHFDDYNLSVNDIDWMARIIWASQ